MANINFETFDALTVELKSKNVEAIFQSEKSEMQTSKYCMERDSQGEDVFMLRKN